MLAHVGHIDVGHVKMPTSGEHFVFNGRLAGTLFHRQAPTLFITGDITTTIALRVWTTTFSDRVHHTKQSTFAQRPIFHEVRIVVHGLPRGPRMVGIGHCTS